MINSRTQLGNTILLNASHVNEIVVNSNIDVEIKSSDVFSLSIFVNDKFIHQDNVKLSHYLQDGRYNIDVFLENVINMDAGIQLCIPKNIIALKGSNTLGDIKVYDLSLNSIILTNTEGDVFLCNSKILNSKIANEQGNVSLGNCNVQLIEVNNSNGDILFDKSIFVDAALNNISGNIIVKSLEKSLKLNYHTSIGDLFLKGVVNDANSKSSLKTKSKMGDIKILLEQNYKS